MAKVKNVELLSVRYSKKYHELLLENPHDKVQQAYKDWEKIRDKEQKAFEKYMDLSKTVSEDFENYMKRIKTELKPLESSIHDQMATMQILD